MDPGKPTRDKQPFPQSPDIQAKLRSTAPSISPTLPCWEPHSLCVCAWEFMFQFCCATSGSTPSLNLRFFPSMGTAGVPERGNEHKSTIFQQVQAMSLYPGILQRGRQIQKTLGTLGCPALVLVTRAVTAFASQQALQKVKARI